LKNKEVLPVFSLIRKHEEIAVFLHIPNKSISINKISNMPGSLTWICANQNINNSSIHMHLPTMALFGYSSRVRVNLPTMALFGYSSRVRVRDSF
jgi:hypothetical protein